MNLLNWNGTDEKNLREVVENMRQVAALAEMLGALLRLKGHRDEYEEDIALEQVFYAGSLGQALGVRALELLDAEAKPPGTGKRRKAPRLAGVTAAPAPVKQTLTIAPRSGA